MTYYSKKTTYKTIEFKSVLEARTAVILDNLKIKWNYEPSTFMLSSGEAFIPDFKINSYLYVEVKGNIDKEQRLFHLRACKELRIDILLISENTSYFYNGTDELVTNYEDTIDLLIGSEEDAFQILSCSNCKKISFVTLYGRFHCRNCDNYNGDHDIIDNHNKIGTNHFYEILKLKRRKP